MLMGNHNHVRRPPRIITNYYRMFPIHPHIDHPSPHTTSEFDFPSNSLVESFILGFSHQEFLTMDLDFTKSFPSGFFVVTVVDFERSLRLRIRRAIWMTKSQDTYFGSLDTKLSQRTVTKSTYD